MPFSAQQLWPDTVFEGEAPTITPFPLERSGGNAPAPAVLICPGGAYQNLADHEGPHVAEWLNRHGFAAAVLRYRRNPHRHPGPIHDAQRALRMMRRNAESWGINPNAIAVLGFSAGGHLASTLAVGHERYGDVPDGTVSDDAIAADGQDGISARPDAAVLCYPVIDLVEDDITHRGARQNLLGMPADHADPQTFQSLKHDLSAQHHLTPNTPPCFLWHTADDPAVPVANSLRFAEACATATVPVELHVYPHGVHGLGLADQADLTANAAPVSAWPDLCLDFLRRTLDAPAP